MNLLRMQHELGATLIIVTHDPQIAKQAEYVVKIIDGEITQT